METTMTPADPPTRLPIATDPMLANIDPDRDIPCELVYIYGFIGKVTEETVRLHQGLDIRAYYEVPRRGIVHHEATSCATGPSTKLVCFGNTCLTYVSGSGRATLPASSLAAVVEARNRKYPPTIGPPGCTNCPVTCCCNGSCSCVAKNYWFRINKDTAKKLGVEIICPPYAP